jgi:hypothetical protein
LGPDRNELRLRYVQPSKFNLAAPRFAQEILEDLNRELLGRTAAVSETEWRKARSAFPLGKLGAKSEKAAKIRKSSCRHPFAAFATSRRASLNSFGFICHLCFDGRGFDSDLLQPAGPLQGVDYLLCFFGVQMPGQRPETQ